MRKNIIRIFAIFLMFWSFFLLSSCAQKTSVDISQAQQADPENKSSPAYQQVLKKLENLTPGETIEVKMRLRKIYIKDSSKIFVIFRLSFVIRT